MMSLSSEVVERIQQFAENSRKLEAQRQQDYAASTRHDTNGKDLEETLRKLQDQVDKQEIVLQKVWQPASRLNAHQPDKLYSYGRINPWIFLNQIMMQRGALHKCAERQRLIDPC